MATITENSEVDGVNYGDMFAPEYKYNTHNDDQDDEDDEKLDEDESLVERLIGLTEMFPEKVRKFGYDTGVCMKLCIKGLYSISRSVTWLLVSSSAILFAPIVFETERARMEEAHRNHQKQVLLGPSSAMSSSGSSGFPIAPIQR